MQINQPNTINSSILDTGIEFQGTLQLGLNIDNYLSVPIYVIGRDNVVYVVSSVRSSTKDPGVLLQKRMAANKANVKVDATNLFNVPNTPEQEKLASSYAESGRRGMGKQIASVDHWVSFADLKVGEMLYVRDLDICISTTAPTADFKHPYCSENSEKVIYANQSTENPNVLCLSFLLIDNTGHFGSRYINIDGDIYHIPAVKDGSRASGLYYTANHSIESYQVDKESKTVRIPLEEIQERFKNIYPTIEEARVMGDALEQKKRDLKAEELKLNESALRQKEETAKAQQELERLRRDLKQQEMEYARRVSDLDQLKSELEHQRQMEKMRRSDYYDERSSARKDNSEWIKQIPTYVSVILSILTLVKMSNNSK